MPIYRIVRENVSRDTRKKEREEREEKEVKMPALSGSDTIDIEDGEYVSFIRKIFFKLSEERNFKEILLPAFERGDLYEKLFGEVYVEKNLFSLAIETEGEGVDYMIRPSAVTGICRKYIEDRWDERPQPVKISWFGDLYTKDEESENVRTHTAELGVLGSNSPSYDIEMVGFLWDLLQKIGLKEFALEINSMGCNVCRPGYKEELSAHLRSYEHSLCTICQENVERDPMSVLRCKEEKCQRVTNLGPKMVDYLCEECQKDLRSVKDGAENMGIEYIENPKLVREFEYYSKTVFEVVIYDDFGDPLYKIAEGGRFDAAIERIGGAETPSVGLTLYIERVIEEMKRNSITPRRQKNRVYMASIGKDAAHEVAKLSTVLQAAGFKAFKPSVQKGISDQFKEAESMNIDWVLLLGEHELETGTILLRNISSGVQTVVLREKLLETLAEKFFSYADEDDA